MDPVRFDALTQALAEIRSRRNVLLGIGGVLAPLMRSPFTDDARAGKNKKKCKRGKVKCRGKCVARCAADRTRNPITCGCCLTNSALCSGPGDTTCCSESCGFAAPMSFRCAARIIGAPCQFGAQCGSGKCTDGSCD